MLEITKSDDVTRIAMSTAITRAAGYSVSAYLVRGILIDVGFPAIWNELGPFLDQARPTAAFITHHHEDHAGNAAMLARRALPLTASAATLALLEENAPIELLRRIIWGTPGRLASHLEHSAPTGFRLIPTPGHTGDHHVVWDTESGTIFSGDLFLGVKVRAVHSGEDPREIARSVRAVAALKPARLFDAHRGYVANPVDSLLAKADWMDVTVDAIERRVAAGWSDRAITREVLGHEEAAYYASGGTMSKINFVRAVRRGITTR